MKFRSIKKMLHHLSTVQTIALGFFVVILTGSVLLSLPMATADHHPTPYIDALFTSTTSVCVTGLVTVNSALHWSAAGKFMILCLIQIGGLGFMTAVTMVFSILKRKVSLRNRLTTQDTLHEKTITNLGYTVKRVVFGTLIIEAIGAIFITIALRADYGLWEAFKLGIFTAISAFCNAGIDIMSIDSLISFQQNALLLQSVSVLIFLGGIGFPVWWECLEAIKQRVIQKRKWRRICRHCSLHVKMVLTITAVLLLIGFVSTLLFEWNNPATMGSLQPVQKVQNAFFQSVTTRTAGFDSLGQENLQNPTRLVSMFLMFIGGSPGSTAGGIKTVTFFVIALQMFAWIRGGEKPKIFHREIADRQIRKAYLIATLSAGILFLAILILSATESGPLMSIAYECVSALATVGLSMGLTANLTVIGKIIIILLMFMGRIGPITLFLAVNLDKRQQTKVSYPEEKVLIG